MDIDDCMSGKEAIYKTASKKYDCILMDIMMPELSGEETLKKLKERDGFNTPVVALTADAIANSKKKYIALGFSSYVAKPFNKEQIKMELEKILK